MSGYQDIKNGAFDRDPDSEKIRLSFQKAKEMFTEIFNKIPLVFVEGSAGYAIIVKDDLSGYDLVPLNGNGDLLSNNNLSDLESAEAARDNLGLGDLATLDAGDFASSAQGEKADSSVQSVGAANGSGLSITEENGNVVIDFDGVATVENLTFNKADKVLTLSRDGDTNITVDLSNYVSLKIDGYDVVKGAGISKTSIEVGDKCIGWDGVYHVAFVVTGLPYIDEGNRDFATKNEY